MCNISYISEIQCYIDIREIVIVILGKSCWLKISEVVVYPLLLDGKKCNAFWECTPTYSPSRCVYLLYSVVGVGVVGGEMLSLSGFINSQTINKYHSNPSIYCTHTQKCTHTQIHTRAHTFVFQHSDFVLLLCHWLVERCTSSIGSLSLSTAVCLLFLINFVTSTFYSINSAQNSSAPTF